MTWYGTLRVPCSTDVTIRELQLYGVGRLAYRSLRAACGGHTRHEQIRLPRRWVGVD